jgi:hypothetical protein
MAHFAILDSENKVIFVTTVANEKIIERGQEVEQIGIDFLFNTIKIQNIYTEAVTAKQTSYNARFRNKYAGLGDTYDADKNAFIAPKPYASWVLNGVNWEAPKAKPEGNYIWDEEKLDWVEFVIPTLN